MNRKARTLLSALEHLPEGSNVVEIGCVRFTEERPSDGFSTVYLAHAAAENGWQFNSVDCDAGAVNRARLITADLPVSVHWADGRDWLAEFPGPIHALYLDGALTPGEAVGQYRAAALAKDAVIVIDDVQTVYPYARGKGDLLIEILEEDGFEVAVYNTEPPHYKMAVARRP